MKKKKAKIYDTIIEVVFILGIIIAIIDMLFGSSTLIDKSILFAIPLVTSLIVTPFVFNKT